jgi:hypothetical protein
VARRTKGIIQMAIGDKIVDKVEELKGKATQAAGKLIGNKQPGAGAAGGQPGRRGERGRFLQLLDG